MRAHNGAISPPHKLSFVQQNIKIDLSSEVQNVTHIFICGLILRPRSVMGHSGVAGKKADLKFTNDGTPENSDAA